MKDLSLFCLIVLAVAACNEPDKQAAKPVEAGTPTPLFISKNTDAFNQPFEHLLTTYYALRDVFVEYDTTQINMISRELSADAGSLQLGELKPDSTGIQQKDAKKWTDAVKAAAGQIAGQKNFEQKQKAFETVSDALYALTRTVKYDKEKLYHQHCPMAFNNKGASWISNSSQIVNPYMGKKHPKYRSAMLECGDIPDSLDFRQ